MSEKRVPFAPVTLEEAAAMLPEGEFVHTFLSRPGMLIGADVARGTILQRFTENGVELSGKMATSMKHGLVYFDGDEPIFVETRPDVSR